MKGNKLVISPSSRMTILMAVASMMGAGAKTPVIPSQHGSAHFYSRRSTGTAQKKRRRIARQLGAHRK